MAKHPHPEPPRAARSLQSSERKVARRAWKRLLAAVGAGSAALYLIRSPTMTCVVGVVCMIAAFPVANALLGSLDQSRRNRLSLVSTFGGLAMIGAVCITLGLVSLVRTRPADPKLPAPAETKLLVRLRIPPSPPNAKSPTPMGTASSTYPNPPSSTTARSMHLPTVNAPQPTGRASSRASTSPSKPAATHPVAPIPPEAPTNTPPPQPSVPTEAAKETTAPAAAPPQSPPASSSEPKNPSSTAGQHEPDPSASSPQPSQQEPTTTAGAPLPAPKSSAVLNRTGNVGGLPPAPTHGGTTTTSPSTASPPSITPPTSTKLPTEAVAECTSVVRP
jgi:hypothetical protein